METAGYFASLIIGLSLGLIGGGGSILTVPVLVYLFHVHPVPATAYSLFIVGATSLAGAYPKYKLGEINLKAAMVFGIPSMAAVYAIRAWVVPAIPERILSLGGFQVTKPLLMMVLFALLMIAASISMVRSNGNGANETDSSISFSYPAMTLSGLLEGSLTGIVGAGGGFLIIPALVLLSKLPMKQAIGTSLLIIAVKSLVGFLGDAGHHHANWSLLTTVTALAILGIFAGSQVGKKIPGASLKKGFGWFVLAMGGYVLVKELLMNGNT